MLCSYRNNFYKEGLKTEIQGSSYEDQIGFLQPFVNQAASHLANRRELRRAVGEEMFCFVLFLAAPEVEVPRPGIKLVPQ